MGERAVDRYEVVERGEREMRVEGEGRVREREEKGGEVRARDLAVADALS